MNIIKCFFGLHKLKVVGHGGFFSYRISQCDNCKSGFQEMDYGPFLKWLTRKKISPQAFKKYLEDHNETD